MTNDFHRKAINEMSKAMMSLEINWTTNTAGYLFGKIVDAVALFGENQDGLTILINPAQQAYFRKQLADSLSYVEAYVRTGYLGSVCGANILVSNVVPEKACFILQGNKAVTLFLKKGTELETFRQPNTRTNEVYIRKVGLVALTDNTKIAMLAPSQTTAISITTAASSTTTVAGTCASDAFKVAVVDDAGKTYYTTPSSGSWSVSVASALAVGDDLTARAYAPAKAVSVDTYTVS